MAKYTKLSQTAALKQVIRRCSSLVKRQGYEGLPIDVPKGHFVVYVGENRSRFIIPLSYLQQSEFQVMLRHAQEEFGFNHEMGLTIPCGEVEFRSLTLALSRDYDTKPTRWV